MLMKILSQPGLSQSIYWNAYWLSVVIQSTGLFYQALSSWFHLAAQQSIFFCLEIMQIEMDGSPPLEWGGLASFVNAINASQIRGIAG